MLNLKKTALAVIALGSTAAFAGTMGPVCSAVNVTVPCENTAWDFGGRALYLQPTSDVGYGTRTTTQNTASVTTGANPAWGWGFQLEGSYHYSTGNDFNLNWYHFRSGGSTNVLGANVNGFVANKLFPGSGVTGLAAGTATSVSPAWDQVNMEFGQHVDFGENKFARLHGGMNFSRVAASGYQFTQLASNTAAVTTGPYKTENYSSVYNGFGPRVGMDLNYEWGNGVGVYATGALSVLAGSSKASVTRANWVTTADGFNNGFNRSAVIPELDAKLGAMYTYAMAQGDLSLDIGWVWAHYTNALIGVHSDSLSTTQLSQFDKTTNDFGIQGLYFGMKWVGNVA
jgi:hypothetical protein